MTAEYERSDYDTALDILEEFSWSSNVMRDGKLVGLQFVVAEAVAAALAKERRATENRALERAADEVDVGVLDGRAENGDIWTRERTRKEIKAAIRALKHPEPKG